MLYNIYVILHLCYITSTLYNIYAILHLYYLHQGYITFDTNVILICVIFHLLCTCITYTYMCYNYVYICVI